MNKFDICLYRGNVFHFVHFKKGDTDMRFKDRVASFRLQLYLQNYNICQRKYQPIPTVHC